MPEAWIIDAVRTPRGVGKAGKGALADIHPQRLGSTVLAAIRDRNNLNTAEVDDIIFGTSMQVGPQGQWIVVRTRVGPRPTNSTSRPLIVTNPWRREVPSSL